RGARLRADPARRQPDAVRPIGGTKGLWRKDYRIPHPRRAPVFACSVTERAEVQAASRSRALSFLTIRAADRAFKRLNCHPELPSAPTTPLPGASTSRRPSVTTEKK